MNLRPSVKDDVLILELFGRFDAYEVQRINDWIEANVTTEKNNLVVGMAGVNFIDSSALAALVKGMKRCREVKGDLALAQLDQSVKIIFELTRLDKAFTIRDTIDEAVEALKK